MMNYKVLPNLSKGGAQPLRSRTWDGGWNLRRNEQYGGGCLSFVIVWSLCGPGLSTRLDCGSLTAQ